MKAYSEIWKIIGEMDEQSRAHVSSACDWNDMCAFHADLSAEEIVSAIMSHSRIELIGYRYRYFEGCKW